jgi:formylglycine-generating enzyme required for sulfatase activity
MMGKAGARSHLNLSSRCKWLVCLGLVVVAVLGYSSDTSLCQGSEKRVVLRSEPRTLTDADIDRLVHEHNFYDIHRNPGGAFTNRLVPRDYGSDRVVFDEATELVWQQSGSQVYMDWKSAQAYIRRLNENRFAGFRQWRLPTVEELASLLERQTPNGSLHVDPAFDRHQAWCWSSDQRGEGFAYLVSYYHGMIDWKFNCGRVFVRAVASSPQFLARPQETIPVQVSRPSGKVFTNSVGMKFVLVSGGSFLMGSSEQEPGRNPNEGPKHRVTLSKPFYLGITEVTQGQWQEVMGDNPSRFRGEDLPVENVSWDDCQEFIRRLNQREKTRRYRLPSEAEWEYACRAGSTTRFCFGDDIGSSVGKDELRFYFGDEKGILDQYAWYGNNAGNHTHPVAQKTPNAWGLYDMHGNVAEWCQDWYAPYPAAEQKDPQGPPTGSRPVLRGGSYGFGSWSVRSALREAQPHQSRSCQWGFRVACDVAD